MNLPLHDIELIERYFDNELTNQETTSLNDRLKSDHELKKLFEQEKLLVNTIRFNAAHNDLQFLKQLDKSIATENSSHIKKRWYYYAAAACVALFIGVRIFLPFSQTPDELYSDYFAPYPNIFEPTLRGEGVTSLRTEAFQAYDQGNYQRAAALFNKLIKENKEPGLLMLLGNSNLMLGKTEEAEKNFNELVNDYDEFDIPAKWFLSLSYLKRGEKEKAINLLKELGSTEISYAAKAKELLKKVN